MHSLLSTGPDVVGWTPSLLGQGRTVGGLVHTRQIPQQLEIVQRKLTRSRCPAHIKKGGGTEKNVYGVSACDVHTLGSSLMLQSLCTVIRFPLCGLWQETGSLMDVSTSQ